MRYDETRTYNLHVNALNDEKKKLELELVGLNVHKRGTQGIADARARVKQRLKTIERSLLKSKDLSDFTWSELFTLWSDACGWMWTKEELKLLQHETESYEGLGEKPLRHRLGLPLDATMESCDLPTGEVKYVGDKVEPIRVGKIGKRMYVRSLREISDELVTDEMLDGEVSAGKLYNELDATIQEKLLTNLAPENVLSCYPAMYLTTDTGYGFVPQEHYKQAFSLACITQMSPKFRLKRSYVEDRIRRTLVVNPATATAPAA